MKNLFLKGLLFSLALFISTTCPYADIVVPKKLNVQGRVTNDSGQPITGKKCEIKLYIDDMNNAIDTKQADLDSEGLYNTNMDLSSFLNNHNFDTTYKFKVSVKPEGESLITSEESDLVAVPYSICSSTSNYSEKLKTDFILSNSNFSTDIYSNIMISPINIKDKGSYDNKYSIKVDSATYADTANNVSGSGIADKSITDAKMADETLEARSIKDSAITTDKIADSAVTSAKLASDVKTDSVESGNSAALTSKGAYTNLVRRNSTTQATGGERQGIYIDADGKVQVGTAVTDTYSSTGEAPASGKAIADALNSYVLKTTTINGSALESDITLYGTSINMSNSDNKTLKEAIDNKQAKIGAGTANNIVAYSGTAGTLNTLTRVESISASASASNTNIPTEKAVRTEIDKKQAKIDADNKLSASYIDGTVANATTAAKLGSGETVGTPTQVWVTDGSKQGWKNLAEIASATYGIGADLAEIYRSKENLQPGDVVSIDTTRDDAIVKTKVAEDTLVAGVISTDPGLLLNSAEKGYKLALVGKVPTKVCNEGGEIKRGDLLVSASIAGYAKKAGDNPKAGTVIGKALENFSSKRGTILVLVNLQ